MCFTCCAGFSFPSVVWGAEEVQYLWDVVLRYKNTHLKRTKEHGEAARPPASPASLRVAPGGKRVPSPRPSAGASTRVCLAHLRAAAPLHPVPRPWGTRAGWAAAEMPPPWPAGAGHAGPVRLTEQEREAAAPSVRSVHRGRARTLPQAPGAPGQAPAQAPPCPLAGPAPMLLPRDCLSLPRSPPPPLTMNQASLLSPKQLAQRLSNV